MQLLLEFVVQEIFARLGALVTRLLGLSKSESGIREMWIGASVVVAVIAIVIAAVR